MYDVNFRVDAVGDLDSDLVARVVVDGRDKLIARPNSLEFYHLRNDPHDRRDLSAHQPDEVHELSALIDKWLKSTRIVFPRTP
ncbi:MAG: hypothetical protein P8L18_14310 [Verrucomicrobiota bacterium]|nr:hypothetical protein [Verrucomicrobiota bacterium]